MPLPSNVFAASSRGVRRARRSLGTLLAGTALAFALAATLAAPAAAQGGDTLVRLNALEQQVRELNGRIEELNFFILQMQEELRRQKEDNEFRFQDLEGGAGGAAAGGTGEQRGDAAPALPRPGTDTAEAAPEAGAIVEGETAFNERDGADSEDVVLGDPPRELGTIDVAPDGTVTGSLEPAPGAAGDSLASGLGAGASGKAVYERGYEFALAGDWTRAEEMFRLHAERFADDATAPQATYWLGEALLAQGRNEEAAEILLDGHGNHAESDWAPDMLLKVGVAMARLGNRDIACATFEEVQRLYPRLPQRTAKLIDDERAAATC